MNYGGGEVQQQMHHMAGHHAHPHPHQYNTPHSATAPSFQYPQHMTHDHIGGHAPHHQQNFYHDANANAARNSLATPSTPSQNISPRFSRMHVIPTPTDTSSNHAQQTFPSPSSPPFVPSDRALPSRSVKDATFADSYARFILYCNPSFPLDTDTDQLKQVFRTPPKSDGKAFNTFTLFELLKRMESKELKTWTELALELGVEKPNVEKNQSSQKIPQYSVRLKRWMRALHIDAFFEYLMGKDHPYYRQVPPLNDPFPEVRDEIPVQEDLALRAIDPKFRPKRGRRRADEQDDDQEPMTATEPKRPQLDTSMSFNGRDDYAMSAYPHSAIPMSAHPDFANGTDPWSSLATPASALAPRSAMSSTSAQQLRWRNETPATPHPLSAITPVSGHPDAWDAEPQSAITPSSARSGRRRRRHGPAVSSAWTSTNTTANGKLRGRPPSNRSVRDGPFVTFPANPKTKEGPTIDLQTTARQLSQAQGNVQNEERSSATPTPSAATASPKSSHQFLMPQVPTPTNAAPSKTPAAVPSNSRPERLQLQVPQHIGNPVRLLTPTLLVNGQLNSDQHRATPISATSSSTPATSNASASTARTMTSTFSFNSTAPSTAVTEPDNDGPLSFLTPASAAADRGSKPVPDTSSTTNKTHSPWTLPSTATLHRALTASLLRAQLHTPTPTRKKKLTPTEAKSLADAILHRMQATPSPSPSSSNTDTSIDDLHRFLCVSWLGLSTSGSGTVSPIGPVKKISVRRETLPEDEDDEGGEGQGGDVYDIEYTSRLGPVHGSFSIKGVSIARRTPGEPPPAPPHSASGAKRKRGETEHEDGENDDEEGQDADANSETWKTRYERVEAQRAALAEELHAVRQGVFAALRGAAV